MIKTEKTYFFIYKSLPMKKIAALFLVSISFLTVSTAQIDITYQKPPLEILELADAQLAPSVSIDDKQENILLMHRNRYTSIAELSETELRLAGLRINPVTNIGSRMGYSDNISLLRVGEQQETAITGLPDNPRLTYFSWSPDQSKIAFTHTTVTGIELWLLDVESASCKKLTDAVINANTGRPFTWFRDGQALLVKMLPDDKKPLIDKSTSIPTGPRVSVSEEGKKAQNRTYQDLLKDKADEFNFEQLARSALVKVDLNGNVTPWKETAMYTGFDISPDGGYVMVSTLHHPFSYLVTYRSFPSKTVIYDKTGKEIKVLLESPLIEDLPQGFMAVEKGMRSINWRNDKPATISYVVALDEGDPAIEVDFRDEIFTWEAPFSGEPVSMLKTVQRYAGITWGNDEIAIARDRWWNTRNSKTYLFNPSDADSKPEIIYDLNYNDRYNDPGSFVTQKNEWGENILVINKDKLYLTGRGYSPESMKPFFDEYDIKSKETVRLWQADGKENLETISEVLDAKDGVLLTRVEASTVYPNYFIRNTKKESPRSKLHFSEIHLKVWKEFTKK